MLKTETDIKTQLQFTAAIMEALALHQDFRSWLEETMGDDTATHGIDSGISLFDYVADVAEEMVHAYNELRTITGNNDKFLDVLYETTRIVAHMIMVDPSDPFVNYGLRNLIIDHAV